MELRTIPHDNFAPHVVFPGWIEKLHFRCFPFNNIGRHDVGCTDVGCLGLWPEQTAYLGVEFLASGSVHYGWVFIDVPFTGINGGTVRSYAYEDEPNTPIIAGSIPEPSTAVLIGTGTTLLLKRNAKTRKENKALLPTPRGWFVSMLSLVRRLFGFDGAHPRP